MTTETYKVVEGNCTTGEVIERNMTDDEVEQLLADRAEAESANALRIQQEEAAAEIKASAEAKLAALGLTSDEVAAIIGR